jgi:Arc/MetJ-type ribon-helix-helix transcriptional regulator
MKSETLLHVKLEQDMKKDMHKLIEIGMFSTEAEIAREAIRNLMVDIKER